MKIMGRVLIGIFIILSLVIGGAAGLLGTPAGLGWLVQQLDERLPGSLRIATVEGGLFGRLRLQQIQYRDQDIELAADELILYWRPSELLQGYLHFADVSLFSPRYTLLQTAELEPVDETTAEAPLTLPGIGLPIKIRLDKAEVLNLLFRTSPEAEPVELSQALLSADWNADGIDIKTLKLLMPDVELSAQGRLNPQGRYALDLNTDLSLTLPDAPKIDTKGRLHGDLQTLHVEQTLSGDVQASLNAVLQEPLNALTWQAAIDLQALALPALAADLEGTVAGMLNAQGDLAQATAQGRIRLDDAKTYFSPWHGELDIAADLEAMRIIIEQLQLSRPDSALQLHVSGMADADLNIDLQGRWNALQWPPAGDAQVSSENGTLTLKGTAEDYALTLTGKLAGVDIPSSELNLLGHGNQEQFVIESLTGQTLGGHFDTHGNVGWAPDVSWDATLSATAINPGVQYPEWPGKLDLALSSKGAIKDQVTELSALINTLKGDLRQRPLNASGRIQLQGEQISLEKVSLSSGSAKVKADGKLGNKSNLAWHIDVANLADLLPDAAGGIKGKGVVTGASTQPAIKGSLTANGIRYQDIKIATLSTQMQLDLSDKTASQLDLHSENIRIAEETIPSLILKATGRKQDHRLDAQLQHGLADLALKLRGAYDEPATRWKGALNTLDIQSKDFGHWTLDKPAKIAAAPNDLRLDSLCLARDSSLVCTKGQMRGETGHASLNGENLPLQWLQAFLPPQIEQLNTVVSLKAEATLDKTPLADVQVKLDPGSILVHPKAGESITLEHQGGHIVANLGNKQLTGNVKLAIGEDGLNGNVTVPRPALDKDPSSAPLQGDLHLRFRQLDLFTGFVPMVQELNGDVRADFKLGGVLGEPSIKGESHIDIQQLQMPEIGLELSDIAVKAHSDDGKHIRLDGGVSSGKGRLTLAGDIELDADKNWPMLVTLKGEKFQLLNLPDMNAQISTDLAFKNGADAMSLEGSLEIPKAYIVVDEIPDGATQPSSDVVVVEPGKTEQAPPDTGAPFAMRVTVISGDDVQFRGFGLKAYFEGKLTVTQAPGEFPTGSGELHIKEGTYKAYGQDLVIEQGILAYSGGRIDNPGLSVRATREANVELASGATNVVVGVDVSGSAKKPELSVYSDPGMEERDAISILLTGNIASNVGKGGGSLGVGKQLTKDFSIGAKLDTETSQAEFVTKYRFNRKLHLEATTSSESNAADVFYSIQFD